MLHERLHVAPSIFLKTPALSLGKQTATVDGEQEGRFWQVQGRSASMSHALVSTDWRKLSQAARKERNPKKFVYLLKQLYDLLNEDEENRSANNIVESSSAKRARTDHASEAA
jgi:hypothetical protein